VVPAQQAKEAVMAIKDLLEAAKRSLGKSEVPAAAKQAPRENIRLSNPWHAVTILPGPKRCVAVTKLLNQRYLSKEAPVLPLKDCTEPACTCRYRHHDDRRLEGPTLDRNGMPLSHPRRRDSD
jgi:hypothetical protein